MNDVSERVYRETPVGTNESVKLRDIEAGSYVVHLYRVAPNCGGEDLEKRQVQVAENAVRAVTFPVVCTRP